MSDLNQLIDAKIKKLEEFKRVLSDPELMDLLRHHFSQNGNSAHLSVTPSRPGLFQQDQTPQRGDLIGTVKAILQDATTLLTGKEITAEMERRGFTFHAQDKHIAVAKALSRLEDRKQVRVHRGMEGGVNRYEKMQ